MVAYVIEDLVENGCRFGVCKSLAIGHVCKLHHMVEFVPKVPEDVPIAPELHASGSIQQGRNGI